MRVKNRKIIRTLTLRSLKAGKLRNLVAVIAIALTSTLFTTIFSMGSNIISSTQNATMRQIGTSAHGGLKYLTQEQYDNFRQSPMIRDISYSIIIGFAQNEELQKKQTEIRYGEDECAKWMFSHPTTGAMPVTGKELACSTLTLDMLGIPHELGQTVPLTFTVHGREYMEDFTLCGFWQGDNVMMAAMVWLSREYTDSVVSVPETFNRKGGSDAVIGTINADVWFSNSFDIEKNMLTLIDERGYDIYAGEIAYGVNWAYADSVGFDPLTILVLGLVIVLILLSGYLIIYSVFIISVTGDIRFYGLLKTIGTTGKQLRSIVRGQALCLSAFGIPLGLIIGYFLGYSLTPALMSISAAAGNFTASVNPLIFIFAAVFSLITIFISCRRPGRIAAKVTPVEAVRYTDVPPDTNRKKAKRTGKVTPFSMAWSNVRRNPRKLAVIVVSLSLSLILFNSVYSIIRGFDLERYLQRMMVSDFSAADYSVYSAMIHEDNYEGVDAAFISGVSALNGLEDMADIYFYDDYFHQVSKSGLENFNKAMDEYLTSEEVIDRSYLPEAAAEVRKSGGATMHIYGIGKLAAKVLEQHISDNGIDYEKLQEGDYGLTTRGWSERFPVYGVGDTVTLTNEKGETREFEVLAVLESYPNSISCQHSHIICCDIILADDVYLDFYGDKQPMMTIFNVSDEHIPAAEEWIMSYIAGQNPSLDYRSRDYYKKEFENLQNTFLIVGGALSFILALIGVLNFINTVITSIFTRRRELAMLQSVGMTGRQLQAMLTGEGATYALLTVLFTSTIGILFSYLIIQVIAGQMWVFTWNFSLIPLLCAILPLLAVCALVPLVCYRFMRRESVVDRLREE